MKGNHTIIKPVYTEKATILNEKQVYVFWVNPKATKIDIKRAIKQQYGSEVTDVRVTNTTSKERKVRKGLMVKRAEGKKAYVTLAKGAKLDLTKSPSQAKAEDKEVKIKLREDNKSVKADAKVKALKAKTTTNTKAKAVKAPAKKAPSKAK